VSKSKFPPIKVDSCFTANNLEQNLIAIAFQSGEMESALCFSPEQAKELIIGLQKSLDRLKDRQQ
jgi:hypothetical protein